MKGRKQPIEWSVERTVGAFNEAGPVKGRKPATAGADAQDADPFNEAGPVKGRKRGDLRERDRQTWIPSMRPAL